jgi:hypothetical protein
LKLPTKEVPAYAPEPDPLKVTVTSEPAAGRLTETTSRISSRDRHQ